MSDPEWEGVSAANRLYKQGIAWEKSYRYINRLTGLRIPFEQKDNGLLVLNTPSGIIDFWSTTGSFFNRKTKDRGSGMKDLLDHLGYPK